MITGSDYLLRGEVVTVTAAWNGTRNPDLPRLQAVLPLVRLKPSAPRNVRIQFPDGSSTIRPFRGLRRPPEPEPAWEQPALGDCGDGYAPPARRVETVTADATWSRDLSAQHVNHP